MINPYLSSDTPSNYKCAKCGATGVKLWREYQTVCPTLLCAVHAAEDQHRSIADIDADGLRTSDLFDNHKTDQIGWYVPAVPVDDTYWGYTSVPEDGAAWWRRLPTLPQEATK